MAAPSDSVRPALEAFLAAHPAPAPPFVRGLLHYLHTPTPSVHTAPCIPAADDVELRMALIRQLRKTLRDAYLPDRAFTAVQVSALLLMPLDALRQRVEEASAVPYGSLRTLTDTRDAVRLFLQGTHPQARHRKRKTPGGQGAEAIEGGASEPGHPSVGRSATERGKDRDGNACVLTGAAHPDVCHIVPFATNSCARNLETTQILFAGFLHFFFPAHDARQQIVPAVAAGLGCSDRSWNMLCISPELHRYWARPYWALQCVGITPVTADSPQPQQRLTMRFYWLRFRPDDPDRKVDIDTEDAARALLAGLADAAAAGADDNNNSNSSNSTGPGVQGVVAAHHRGSNHPLVSGEEFAVLLDTRDDALRMKAMLDIQWALVTIAAMSGAVGPADDNDDNDDMSELDSAREAYERHALLYGDEDDASSSE